MNGCVPECGPSALSGLDANSSFRDPAGHLFEFEGRILRFVRADAASDVLDFLHSPAAGKLADEGRLVRTVVLDPGDGGSDLETFVRNGLRRIEGGIALEHERIPFPSFPYEWPPEMLHSAAALTLDLAEIPLREGFGLKDATPYNVLFRGAQPVFVDLLSFERRHPGDPTWRPYAQFVRTFLLPLAISKYYGVRLDQMLTARRDGVEPEEAYRLLKLRHKITPPFLALVSMPKWLGSALDTDDVGIYEKKILGNAEKAGYILETLLGGLRRSLRRVKPVSGADSVWSGYMRSGKSYSSEQFDAKHVFVEQVLREYRPKRVLDVGCNTGHFSLLAAEAGASVVAIDQDPVVVGETWRGAKAKGSEVLPLVVDLCRPSPAVGWQNRECRSFLERARGSFDALLMLAVIHHMLVTERVPLESIVDLAAELTTDLLVIEFVGPDDPMFRRLLRGRGELHRDLTVEVFESKCRARFEIVRRQAIEGCNRYLYLLRRISSQPRASGGTAA